MGITVSQISDVVACELAMAAVGELSVGMIFGSTQHLNRSGKGSSILTAVYV